MNRREVLVGTASAITAASAASASPVTAPAPPPLQAGRRQTADGTAAREIADLAIIQNILAGSALSADIAATAYQLGIYADDAVLDVGGLTGEIRGRDAIVGVIKDDSHKTLRAEGMAHVASQPHILVKGSRAVAVGYLQILVPAHTATEEASRSMASSVPLVISRLTANRWEFEIRAGRWQITRRTIRPAPSQEALELLRLN